MAGINVHDLFLALIVLTCIILVLLLILLLNHCIKRHTKNIAPTQSRDVETGCKTPVQQQHPSYPARPKIQREHYSEQQRLPRLTTITPAVELLPEIRTSSERADDWLERRDSRMMDGDGGKVPKTYKVLGLKNEGALRWDWRGEKVYGGGDGGNEQDTPTEPSTG
ncbi:hypothetical protein CC86DRAFT_138814 [Ophiobolus disseminans]|uniref:Uncharacterized protein n=1 Tax=Ophiobolus disseminans TaxID=1469910 RepID=A0A6A7AE13_9PLEO|nr:hypothetical protein CC86DRAFT_138814 [Ophiobolus disseminans]